MKIRAIVLTYNRPRHLRNLLIDLREEGFDDVVIYDDASTASYECCQYLLAQNPGWQTRRARDNHGKRNFWRWLAYIYKEQLYADADGFVFLPDDVRLCRDFKFHVLDAWQRILDERKVALTLMRDSSRADVSCWTGVLPSRRGDRHWHTGWTDGLFFCTRRFFDALDYTVPPVADDWHRPDRGSGAYKGISQKLMDMGAGLYSVHHSLVVHVDGHSRMHPQLREQTPMHALDYIDGEVDHDRLADSRLDVQACLATMPDRAHLLPAVVESLRPQVDKLRVWMQGHTRVPSCLRSDEAFPHSRNAGDQAKFSWWGISGYTLTCDDDLVYPANYAEQMIDRIEAYQRRGAMCVHGSVFPVFPIQSYHRGRTPFHTTTALAQDQRVHVIGTGTLGAHRVTVPMEWLTFEHANMADVWFAVAAQRHDIPRVAIARPARWLRYLPPPVGTTIWDTYTREGEAVQNAAVQDVSWCDVGPAARGRDGL